MDEQVDGQEQGPPELPSLTAAELGLLGEALMTQDSYARGRLASMGWGLTLETTDLSISRITRVSPSTASGSSERTLAWSVTFSVKLWMEKTNPDPKS